jgi:hypothetical protein
MNQSYEQELYWDAGGHPGLMHAAREIKGTYGDKVSWNAKAKSLLKFGKSSGVGAALETVWNQGGDEVYLTDNGILAVSSANPTDNQQVRVEGHTVEGTGTDAKFTFVVQDLTLNGQSPVLLATPLARASRLYNFSSTELTGPVYAHENGTLLAGVPVDVAEIHLATALNEQQTEKCATTFSQYDYFAMTEWTVGVTRNAGTAEVDFDLEIRAAGEVFRPKARLTANNRSGSVQGIFDPPLVIAKNSDVRVRAISTLSATPLNAEFRGYIGLVVT